MPRQVAECGGMDLQGIYSPAQLRDAGITRHHAALLVKNGSLRRIRPGWYATDGADEDVQRALKAGARLGCLSGCRHHGLWVPNRSGIHVVYGSGTDPVRRKGLIAHPYGVRYPPEAVWPLSDCLRQVAVRHPVEDAMIVAESALNLGLAPLEEVRWALGGLPKKYADYRDRIAPAQSGSETRVRLLFVRRRVPVRAQAEIDGVGFVDLLVGDSLIVECDSQAHHGETNYENDRRRDLAARGLGYTTLRLSYQQIWKKWPATQQSLIHELRKRRHLRPT